MVTAMTSSLKQKRQDSVFTLFLYDIFLSTNNIKSKTFFPGGGVLNTKFYFYVIFPLHLEKAVFKLKYFEKVNITTYSLMNSYFHEKRLPRICLDVVTIVSIQNCEDFVFFIDCS